MSIRVTCQKCGVVLKVKVDLAGTKCKCPACKGTLYVPTLEEAAQAAAGPLGATETSPAASAGDTGAIKVPAKAKPAQAAGESRTAPPPEANGSPAAHAPSSEPPPAARMESPPAAKAESSTDDLAEPAADATPKAEGKSRLTMPDAQEEPTPKAEKPKAEGKQKLRMSDTDAEESAPAAEKPKADAGPKAKPDAKPPAKSDKDEFDLDSFLMEGPKPKAPPPISEESAEKKGPAARPGSGRRLSMSDDETNVSGPSETLPPPNRGRGSAAESAMAALTGGAGTASSAKDLLARATQEGRARAAQMPDEAREGFDFAGAFKAIYQQYGLQTIGVVVACAVLYFGMDYMMGGGVDLPPLARVYGKVTLKGQAVEGVVVNFTPIGTKDSNEQQSKVKGSLRSATGVTDKEGNFELMYMEGVRGAVLGQNRVWINPVSPENYKKVPGQWTSAGTSGDIREVKETGGEENIELQK